MALESDLAHLFADKVVRLGKIYEDIKTMNIASLPASLNRRSGGTNNNSNNNNTFEKSSHQNIENNLLVSCSICSKANFTGGYRYVCLICHRFMLCSSCFENRKCNKLHTTNHPVLRIDEDEVDDRRQRQKRNDNVNTMSLEFMEKTFRDECHRSVRCNGCGAQPLRGLRFKCDVCYDYDLCLACFRDERATQSHSRNHPMVVIERTESLEVSRSGIEILRGEAPLGRGGFGVVYRAKFGPSRRLVACKVIKYHPFMKSLGYDPQVLVESYLRELMAFSQIKGDNVLKMIGHSSVNPGHESFELIILTELMEKGSLANLLENEKNMTYLQRLGLAIDIASGLSRIHDLNFIHRDIRPDNILVDANYKAKIADMGIAKVFKQRNDQTLAGCRDYMPPEFYTGNYTKKLDIFTFGLTLNELFGGKHAMWRGINIHVEPKADVFYYFVERCINNEANNRPIAKSIESDLKLFNKVTNSFIEKLPPLTYAQKSVDEKNRIFKIVYDETLILYKNHNL